MQDDSGLKPCPFCGGKDFTRFAYPYRRKPGLRGSYVQCNGCGASSGRYETIEDAGAAWNERTAETETVLRLEKQRE
jgi:Lar family restriction alleviation protein